MLICLQVLVGVLYKVSQSQSKYAYSTLSVMTLAEAGKFVISASLHFVQAPKSSHMEHTVWSCNLCTLTHVSKISLLALLYFINNQLAFSLFLWADPASINLLKAGSSLITAVIWCIFMGQLITLNQWAAIALQVLGLIVVQIDACKGMLLMSPLTYAAIGVSAVITALSSVWNEQQLKSIDMTLHEQNMVLYLGGVILNVFGFLYMKLHDPVYPSFFQGYTLVTACIIAVNACFGVVVTAVYKHADAVLKTLASAITTVALLLLSFAFFGLQFNINRVCGCAVVVIAVAQYATCTKNPAVLSWAERRVLIRRTAYVAVIIVVVAFLAEQAGISKKLEPQNQT